MQNEMLCVLGCPKPSSKTLTLTITNKSHQIIPSFIFYILHFILDHPIIQSKQPFLTHFWEVDQVPTTQSLTITEILLKIIPSLKQINLVSCYIYPQTNHM